MSIVSVQRPEPGAPGSRARMIVLRLRMRTLIALGALAIQTTFAGRAFGLRSPWFIGSELLLLSCILLISRFVLPLVDRHDRGASGEEHVGGLLDRLIAQGWQVIHHASLGRGDVDHIVIGPGGAFTVETKSHPGPIAVGQVHGATLRQAHSQRQRLERAVGMPVEPLIVYSRAWVDRPLARRKGVRVLPARMLIGYLRGREPSLTPQEVDLAARRLRGMLPSREQLEIGAQDCGGRPRAPTGARGSVLDRARNRSVHDRSSHS
jgi:Nuclease-related domain